MILQSALQMVLYLNRSQSSENHLGCATRQPEEEWQASEGQGQWERESVEEGATGFVEEGVTESVEEGAMDS